MGKDGKNKSQHLVFLSHNTSGHSQGVALIDAEKFVTEIFIGEKEKCTNKGNDEQEEAESLLHTTTSYTQHLYQISKS